MLNIIKYVLTKKGTGTATLIFLISVALKSPELCLKSLFGSFIKYPNLSKYIYEKIILKCSSQCMTHLQIILKSGLALTSKIYDSSI